MNPSPHFSANYAEARAKFLAATADLDVASKIHPRPGRDGETLAMDVARDGSGDASRLLIISSGCHGIEGFAGSGIQIALLNDAEWRAAARQAGVAVLYIHGLNPYGFSWWRRTTHENVDLNRNFQDFSRPPPANPAYDELADLLVPAHWPPSLGNWLALAGYIARRGTKAMQAAVSTGQYDHPHGLFFGGRAPTWSQTALREVLREHGARSERIAWIDLHTGLGPSGVGERIFACRPDAPTLARARAWWGEKVTTVDDGSSSSAPVTGQMFNVIYDECPQAQYTGIALEYGTLPLLRVLHALRADQWLENHPEAPPPLRRRIKAQMRRAFFTDSDQWKLRVVQQAREAVLQAVRGLSGA
jgi:hypothetical protein